VLAFAKLTWKALADVVHVLLRVYAKCISGQQDEAKRRILEATRPTDTIL
jgi:hypothetical protein